jgi:hypothetical protein
MKAEIGLLQLHLSDCIFHVVESNTYILYSFFQREIHSPRDPLKLTRNQAGDSTLFASILAMPTTTSLLPTYWDLPGIQWLGLHDPDLSSHPRSQAWALGTSASPELHIFRVQASSSTWQWPSTLMHRA